MRDDTTGGIFSGGIAAIPTPFGGLGGGAYVDGAGNVYLQLYWGTPGLSFSWGYASDVGAFLTGASAYAHRAAKRNCRSMQPSLVCQNPMGTMSAFTQWCLRGLGCGFRE